MTNPYRVTWDRWDEVDALFDRALDLPAEGREAFLQGICGDDPPLLEAVLELLAKDGPSAAERLAQPSRTLIRAAVDSGSEAGSQGLGPGDLVGRYRVVTELGRGGMATVYEAERADGAFDRLVALKVLRRGLDTEALVRRFLSERQILSGLTHPNIATLLDGGATEDGRPYLVMELVRGSPITEWADHHSLGTRERVESFLQVVDAVAFAHAQLIVHRDLKPSNVLVTAEGMATLLDFGVAKLLDVADEGEEALTRVAPAPMTPEYASPEQIQGGRVTAASDVFQLGALLYRLLTGVRPFEDPAARLRGVGLERAVRRPSESAPGDRARSLRGDLDTIILKALRPEPESRYGSVHALGADLRRYLAGHPISARPASPVYRMAKFSRRNPWFWPAAAILTIGFAGYLTTVVRYSNQVELERNEAVSSAGRAEAIRAFMVNQFGAADPYSDDPVGPDVTVVEAMSRGAASARRELAGQPLLQAEMLSAIAGVYRNLSRSEPALELLDEAMTIRRRVGADQSAEQLKDLSSFAFLLGEQGQRDSAETLLLGALERERAMFGTEHPRAADVLESLGWHHFVDGDPARAQEWYEEAARIRRAQRPLDVNALSSALATLADAYRRTGNLDEAAAVATEAYEIAREELGEAHAITAGNKTHLAQVYDARGERERAIAAYRDAIPVLEERLGPQHSSVLTSWNNLGMVLLQAGDLPAAEEVHRRLLAAYETRFGTAHNRHVAAVYQNLAANTLRQGRYDEADSLAALAGAIYRDRLGAGHYAVAYTQLTRSEALIRRGRGPEAESAAREAISILSPRGEWSMPGEIARCRLGRALILQGLEREARPLIQSALQELDEAEGVPPHEAQACREAWTDLEGAPDP